eukprot:1218320-Rhodomonas_salina.1
MCIRDRIPYSRLRSLRSRLPSRKTRPAAATTSSVPRNCCAQRPENSPPLRAQPVGEVRAWPATGVRAAEASRVRPSVPPPDRRRRRSS